MDYWWDRWPGRLEAEVEAFRRIGLKFSVDEAEKAAGRIILRGNVEVSSGETTLVEVVYPDTFPSTRPTFYATRLELNRHQNPIEGNLCLIARGSQYWRPSY